MKMILGLLLLSISMTARAAETDPYLWLEDVQSAKSMDWVKAHNDKSLGLLTKDKRYAGIEKDVRAIIMAKDKLAYPNLRGGWVYNFWQDADHIRGLWRRAKPEEYAKADPKWDILLDIDKLNADEKQDWVWEGSQCLPPAFDDCLVMLSHGGKDATVVREFDVAKTTWIADGFTLPEAKTTISWLDAGRVWVGTDFGPGSMTKSGYPRISKLWTRGQPLAQAKTVFEGDADDVADDGTTNFRPEGSVSFVDKQMTFWTAKHWIVEPDFSLKPIALPDDADVKAVFDGEILAVLRSDWKVSTKTWPQGALIALPLSSVWDAKPEDEVELVWAPDARSSISDIATAKSYLYIDTLQNVQGKVLRANKTAAGWHVETVPLPELGTASVRAADDFFDPIYVSFESFVIPTTIYTYDASGTPPAAVKSLPARFDARGLVAEQFEATSKDGTRVPYFLIHRDGMKLDGTHPTLLYGYGGFEVSMDPYYLNDMGKVWASQGEVFALANIRGGGEFGPKWHEAALKENRQRAYDDFAAVAEDLIARKVTSPRRLGIMGGSNGGLLVGATFTERPELFNAVVCQVPLLDMIRYTKIAAGASWIGEYGDPEDPKMAAAILKYSPYQNVKKGVKYPEVLFVTSTKDDRVGPVHARKMAAKLEAAGHKTLYWENIEGGHGAAADLEERVRMKSLQFDYLFRKLVD